MSCTDPPSVAPPLQLRIKPDTLVKVGDEPRFVIGYWSIRGLAAPLRMMLHAARGVPHWIAMYDAKEEGENGWNQQSWEEVDKPWLKTECSPFMNLPYLIDVKHQVILNQTNAIMTYLGQQLDMMGSTELETAKCHELLCEIYDLRNIMTGFAYNGDMVDKAASCWKRATNHLDKLEAYLKDEDQTHLVGDGLTAPDFHLFEMLDQYATLLSHYKLDDDDTIEKLYPKLAAYKASMEKENQAYLSSFLHKNLPFNNPYAHFGSDPVTKGAYKRGQDTTTWQQQGTMEIALLLSDDDDKKRGVEAISK